MLNDLRDKAVLITGGTKGIGLAIGLAFGRQGARCTLTHKWGSVDEDDVLRAFADAGAPAPRITQADVINGEDTDALLEEIAADHGAIEVFVSNVSFAQIVRSMDDLSLRGLQKSIEYSAWPLVEYTRRIKARFGRYPRYVIGLSSGGPDRYTQNYDFVAASKSVLETLCRYLNHRLFEDDVRINIIRAAAVSTDSLRDTLGSDFESFVEQFKMSDAFVTPDEVARAALALSSGLMDGVSGQTLVIDNGAIFSDTLMRIYAERKAQVL